jgi:hypothetical protein
MARSIFKRVMKIGNKEVRKSIAGLAMGKPRWKSYRGDLGGVNGTVSTSGWCYCF